MAKRLDLSRLKRPEKKQETRIFTDPLQPGVELEITFEFPLYFHEAAAIQSYQHELLEFWRDTETGISRFPPVDGVQTTLDVTLAFAFALMERLQPDPPLYDVMGLNELSVLMPNALAEVSEWAHSLVPRGEEVKGGTPSRSMRADTSSASGSDGSMSTLTLPDDGTSPSGASTNGSASSAALSEEETLLRSLDASLMSSPTTG